MRTILALALFCSSCFGQGSNTIYQVVFSKISTSNTQSAAVQNIGQSAHLLQVLYTNAPSHTCSASATQNVHLEGSFDNTAWFPIGAPVSLYATDANGNLSGASVVFGSYPYIRVNAASFDSTNCRLTAFYSGTLFPISIPSNVSASNSNFQLSTSELTGGAGTNAIVSSTASTALMRIAIYGLHVLNQAASATPVTITDRTGGCGGGSVTQQTLFSATSVGMPAGAQITWPASSVPYFVSLSVGDSICLTTTNANVVSAEVVFRYE